MDSKERHELKKEYTEQIENCKGYAGISAIMSGAFLVVAGLAEGYNCINNTTDFRAASIMSLFFSTLCALTTIAAIGAIKVVSKRRAKLFDKDGKVDLATALGEEKGESTKEHSDYVNKITKGK